MKKLAFLTFAMLLLFTACSDKDSCEVDDWVGTYTGSFDCLDTPQNVTVVIEEGSEENTVAITIDGETNTTELSGCSITLMDNDIFGEISVTMTLDGENINYDTSGNLFGVPFECNAVLTK